MPDQKKPEPKKNMGASVRARLLAISKANGQVFDLVPNRYASGFSAGPSSSPMIAWRAP
jgi:hypothetical protein